MSDTNEFTEQPEQYRQRTKWYQAHNSLMAFITLIILILIASVNVVHKDFSIIKFMNNNKVEGDTYYIILLFIVFHHIRIWLGLNFITYDTSFRKAVRKWKFNKPVEIKKLDKAEIRLRWGLYVTGGLFVIALGGGLYGNWGLVALFSIQAIILLSYNWLFHIPLYRLDEQRNNNVAIGLGDLVVVFFAIYLVFARINSVWVNNLLPCNNFILVSIGAMSVIFAYEWIVHYWPSLKLYLVDMQYTQHL